MKKKSSWQKFQNLNGGVSSARGAKFHKGTKFYELRVQKPTYAIQLCDFSAYHEAINKAQKRASPRKMIYN